MFFSLNLGGVLSSLNCLILIKIVVVVVVVVVANFTLEEYFSSWNRTHQTQIKSSNM